MKQIRIRAAYALITSYDSVKYLEVHLDKNMIRKIHVRRIAEKVDEVLVSFCLLMRNIEARGRAIRGC